MFTELKQPLPVSVREKGNGLAFAVIDYGIESDLLWVVILDDSGEIWCVPNPKVRVRPNWSVGRASTREDPDRSV